MTASAIYAGTIRHRRAQPRTEFTHDVSLVYVDLDELPTLLGGRLLRRGPGTIRFRRRDYLGPASLPLDVAVRERVAELSGHRPTGPVRLLTQLRSFGLCFNPVSFYYCFDADTSGEVLHSVLAEVTNTPWGERHSYLLSDRSADSAVLRGRFAKQLHVSPFMGMDHVYEARAGQPGPMLSVHIESRRGDEPAFDATLALRRAPLSRRGVARMTARHPLATARVLALIYGHALALKLRGARVHPHPEASGTAAP
ncbi:MAG TPA: DUF1365 domain-containing protein [Solirubrobacteraceae bacterium]|nr:DUF1365 domain-containing protein [Solirubrobacteraceae bacterium]